MTCKIHNKSLSYFISDPFVIQKDLDVEKIPRMLSVKRRANLPTV